MSLWTELLRGDTNTYLVRISLNNKATKVRDYADFSQTYVLGIKDFNASGSAPKPPV